MNNIKRKSLIIISLLLVVLSAFSCFALIGTSAATTSTRVYFYNAGNWSDVYFYEYSDTGLGNDKLGAWPGTKATAEGGNWYYVDVPLVANGNDSCFNIIAHNNAGENDLRAEVTIIDTVNVYFTNVNDITYASKSAITGEEPSSQPATPDSPAEPSKPAESTSTRVYFYNSDNWSDVYFYEYSTTGLGSDKLGEWPGIKATPEGSGWYYVDVPLVANGN
ncbi:MAG: starch-binding protein, partial [Ruminococcus sp.]